ncbi:MAG: hypothetical protein ACE5E7_05415 [Anaerolineae bacterium]
MMRKLITASLTFLLAALVACGGEVAPEVTGGQPVPQQEANPPQATATLPPPVITESGGQTAAEPAPAEVPVVMGPWPPDRFGYGIQAHGNATVGDPAITMEVIRNQLGLDWVKIQVQWWLVQPDPGADQWFFYDSVIEQAHAKGLHTLVSVVGAPEWTRAAGGLNGPPDDYTQFASFLVNLLDRYPGQIDAIEVWNEQNLDREWATPSGLNAAAYVDLLQRAYEAIKATTPDVIVISGALSPTGGWTEADGRVTAIDDFVFLDQMLAAGLLNYADCIGVHHNGYNIGPDVAFDQAGATAEAATASFRGPFDNPHHSWSFKTTLDTYADKVQALDPAKKLCVTEFGWASSEGYNESPVGFGFALDNTVQEQAEFIVQAYQQMRASGNVWLAFLFNFDFGNKGNGPTDDPIPYSIIDTNGSPRPAFDALSSMEKLP